MSTTLAIAGVSAVLQYYLFNMYSLLPTTMFGTQVMLSAKAPDLVQASFAAGSPENQVNLFLHQVTYNTAWRNMQLPSLAADGVTLLKSPPLALDLHYLLTAYGNADWQAEGMLGYALMMFHENPIISRSDISSALEKLSTHWSSNGLSSYLATCALADQVEMIKITPATLGREEMAWLWTALKADYRPTFPFQVSVVLMQPQKSMSMAIPVLRQAITAQAAPPSQIVQVLPPNGPAARFSDQVTVTGLNLSATTQVQLTNPRLQVQMTIPVPSANVSGTSLSFVTNDQTTYPAETIPAGVYTLVTQVADATGKVVSLSSNSLPFALAPTLPPQTASSIPNPDLTTPNTLVVTVNGITPVWEGQTVSLSLTNLVAPPPPATLFSLAAPAMPFTGNNNTTLQFVFPNTLPLNVQLLGSLIVDGVSSVVQVTIPPLPAGSPAGTPPNPPQYSGPWVVVS